MSDQNVPMPPPMPPGMEPATTVPEQPVEQVVVEENAQVVEEQQPAPVQEVVEQLAEEAQETFVQPTEPEPSDLQANLERQQAVQEKVEELNTTGIDVTTQPIPIQVVFNTNAIQISVKIKATRKEERMVIANKEIRMLSDRFYTIPVNVDQTVNSDSYNIKVFSNIAEYIDVLYIKDGMACIAPRQHGITLKDQTNICVLYPL